MKKAAPFFIVFFAALFLFSGFMLIREIRTQQKEAADFEELSILISPPAPEATRPQGQAPEQEATEQAAVRNLAPLFARNKDCIGWVNIAGTQVNYPVMHTPTEPERYLRKNFDKKSSTAGVPFLDGKCTLSCDNLILYGHNMRNGTMFADITKYEDKDYFDAHSVMELETAEGISQFSVFAVVRLKMDDSWYLFHTAQTEEEYTAAVAEIKSRALYNTGITPAFGSRLITLSTCYGANKADRIVVIGAEITE